MNGSETEWFLDDTNFTALPSPSRSSTSTPRPRQRAPERAPAVCRIVGVCSILSIATWFGLIMYIITADVLTPPNFQGSIQQPQQVHLSISGHHSIVITWATATDTASSTVQLADTVDGFDTATKFYGASTRFNYPHSPLYAYEHRVMLEHLEPQRRYFYRVGHEGSGWSSVFWFKAPRGANEGTDPVHLAVYGDLGDMNSRALPRLQTLAQTGSIDFVVHVGDFAYDLHSDEGRRGDAFMNAIESVAAYVPYQTCAGNHEIMGGTFEHYRERFSMPLRENGGDNQFYSFDYGPVHFVAMSTEYYFTSDTDTERQYEWLLHDLKEANKNRHNTPWVILYGHRPPFCSNIFSKDDCTKKQSKVRMGLQQSDGTFKYGLQKLLISENVDVAFFGHEHSYERFHPFDSEHPEVTTKFDGTAYEDPHAPIVVISGAPGGSEEHDPIANGIEHSALRSAEYGFGRLQVHNHTTLYFEQQKADSDAVIDSFWIVKNRVQ